MLSTKDAVRHTPPWLTGEDAPVFLLRHGSVIERAMLEAELGGEHQAGRVFSFEVLDALKAGIGTLLADDPARDQLLELVVQDADPAVTLSETDQRLIDEARKVLAEHWPAYRDLNAQMARRKEIAPIIALRRFLIGWENVPHEFARGADGLVPFELLGRVDSLQMLNAGNAAYGLLYPKDMEGNSPRPSPSDETPTTSTSDDTSKAAGKSTAGTGPKTPGSRSRRKSSASSTSG